MDKLAYYTTINTLSESNKKILNTHIKHMSYHTSIEQPPKIIDIISNLMYRTTIDDTHSQARSPTNENADV